MKTMTKKLGAIILALAMCFSLTCVAFAADTYSITVENSIGGVNYTVYKVFDATYATNEDGETTAVSYTITENDPWYSLVSGSDSPFTLTPSPDGSYYVVSTTASESDIASWFNNITEYPAGSQVGDTKEGNGGSLIFNLDEAGYYLIVPDSDLYEPVAVTVDTAAPDATVVDKNQAPGVGGGVPLSKDASSTSVSVGDEVDYTIKSYVPTYDGEDQVTDYTITDTMGAGLTLEADIAADGTVNSGVKVEITGTGIDGFEDITEACKITVTYDAVGDTILTVTWTIEGVLNTIDPDSGLNLVYPADAVVQVTYTDKVNEAADDLDMFNSVDLTWHRADGSDGDIPTEPTVTEYTYGFDLKKTDNAQNALDGAEFTLDKQTVDEDSGETTNTPISFIYDETSNTYDVWDGEETSYGSADTTISVGENGVNIWGLGEGTYILTETKAPDGYNLLSSSVTIEIKQTDNGWTVTVNGDLAGEGTISNTDEHGVVATSIPVVSIVNNAGTELPSTGGIGTTIFYIIGGVLVAGAVVVLITRRRMNSAD